VVDRAAADAYLLQIRRAGWWRRGTGRPIGYGRAFIRWLGSILSVIPLFLGYFWMLWDREKQTWHDKMAGSVVVDLNDRVR
jgi:uncharacterized RDD family membrane protein YckC